MVLKNLIFQEYNSSRKKNFFFHICVAESSKCSLRLGQKWINGDIKFIINKYTYFYMVKTTFNNVFKTNICKRALFLTFETSAMFALDLFQKGKEKSAFHEMGPLDFRADALI